MNVSYTPSLCRFALDGMVTDIDLKPGEHPRAVCLKVDGGETYYIKLHKRVWRELVIWPSVGDRLRVMGERVYKPKKQDYRYKADYVEILAKAAEQPLDQSPSVTQDKKPQDKGCKDKILVCQKSSCCRRGGKELWQALEQNLVAANLHDQVSLKATGCMGQCKRGPVMVVAKKRYTQVKPNQVKPLLDTLNSKK
ncbi:(2Fe-2S) ferredoxin domain-containing protein [Candidatus Synechococcus calcipolaris G9]|uniref:(2Fe-2S) ferredoxin domain-containing protein n=1 Tax=Candidatus Synechococcus calcipolaris G9 TaxID=1497997 RepID=A0ABT6F2I6_9SYNE|nr:(2Fe-2S) ferredoxin domain-containing protein [Candidatus Synechococcus calcipolaris]MDG2992044.1 (2Fe-2S) ferredoxin domain-containing protein [Candidatus Synechococcus calcipolaris G9]